MNKYNYHRHPEWEDARQDAYLLMLEKKLQFPDKIEEEKWLYVTTVNFIKNIDRKNSHSVHFSSFLKDESDCSDFGSNILSEYEECQFESSVLVDSILNCIERIDKEILMLRISGFKFDEIAEYLEINSNYARKRYERLKIKIIIFIDNINVKAA